MAYNNKNLYLRILDIKEIYRDKKKTGATDKFIFENYIRPVYRISEKTFYNYLVTNAKKRLEEEEEKLQRQGVQTSLF